MKQIVIGIPTMLLTFAVGVTVYMCTFCAPAPPDQPLARHPFLATSWMCRNDGTGHPIESKDKRISLANRTNEEYAVYSAVINRYHVYDDGKLVLIGRQTSYPHDLNNNELEFIKQYIPDSTSIDTLEDYKAQNQRSHELTSHFRLNNRYALISNPKRYFESEERRLAFHTEYPNSTGGITLFSRVGFNSEMDQALVYAWKYCGGLCGGDGYYLLSKKNGVWTVAAEKTRVS